jgi:alkylhydroperoxidase/carboxymuconolactone decarboxylase family protein YurZ
MRSLSVVAGLVMGTMLVWMLGLNAQTRSTSAPAGILKATIPYPTWNDGTQPDHMVPGQAWETAYQPDKWPSQRQRAYVKQLENYHPQVYAAWGKRLNQALTNRKLDKRYEMLVAVATASLAHWARPVIEYYIDLAFDAGSNTSEIIEAMKAGSEVNGHSLYDGLGALWYVVHARQQAGKPTPLEGAPLPDKDLIPNSEWTPVHFKYQLPNPRPHGLARWKFDQEGEAIGRRQAAERRKLQLPQHLPARMEELLWMASDTAVVRWPDPLLDHHHHLALNRGSNLQEIVEVMMIGAEVVQGAEDSNIAGRRVPAGVDIMVHGLEALSRVVAERQKAGYKTPAEYGEGFTKKMY